MILSESLKKVCIISSVHLSYNPRVLKEADAFYEKGYEVTVVTINGNNTLHGFDDKLMQSRKWKLKTVNFRKEDKLEKLNWFYFTFIHLFFRSLSSSTYKFGIAEWAAIKGYPALLKLAKAEHADLYIVHHAEALAIGCKAAKSVGAKIGFDAEDFQTGMSETQTGSREERLLTFLEKKYLPHVRYFTAASKGIGNLYSKNYNAGPFHTILNVFPNEAISEPQLPDIIKFYWYSQVIGPNRSLEILLQAAAELKGHFELHLRGKFHNMTYQNVLREMVNELGLQKKVFFHSPILADEIISDAAGYDVGLALESDISINRNICVTNKIFTYLMAGLAIIGTDTEGQLDIFKSFPNAVRICKKGQAADLKQAMQFFLDNPDTLLAARKSARKAATQRFNWEHESKLLLAVYEEEQRLENSKITALPVKIKTS